MGEIIFMMIAFIFVITLSYYLTKKLASLSAVKMQGKNMRILETLHLGANQYMHLVKVGDKVFVVGVGKEAPNYFCEINEESIDLSAYNVEGTSFSFEEYLEKFKSKINK